MGGMWSSGQEQLSFVSTSVTATAPPVSSVPAYNVSTDNELRSRKTETHAIYLPGFECLVNLHCFSIHKRLAGCGFLKSCDIVVTNGQGKQILQVEQPERDERVFRRIKKRLQCNDLSGRPLFSLSRYLTHSGIQLPPAEGEFLGYIAYDQSTFFVMNNKQEVIIKSSLDPTEKVTAIERYFPQAVGPTRIEKVGTLMVYFERIDVNISQDLDIALKACLIAIAIDSLLPKEK